MHATQKMELLFKKIKNIDTRPHIVSCELKDFKTHIIVLITWIAGQTIPTNRHFDDSTESRCFGVT